MVALPFVIAAATLVGGCGTGDTEVKGKAAPAFTDQERAVYSAILARTFNASSYVLMNRSAGMDLPPDAVAEESDAITRELETLSRDTLDSFGAANPTSVPIPAELELGVPCSLIDQDGLAALVASSPSWDGFFARYPEAPGVLTIAHVGFDAGNGQALAVLRWQAGGLAAWGRYFLLQRSGDTWTVVDDVITVIS
jgi:hypothetical protein